MDPKQAPSSLDEPNQVTLGRCVAKGIHRELHTLRLPLSACSAAAADAIQASPQKTFPPTFDLVCTGGGLMAYHGGAVACVLAHLQRRGLLHIDRLYGVSCGALVGCCYLGFEAGHMQLECVYRCQQLFVQGTWLAHSMRQFLDEVLPPDVHARATNRLHITVRELTHCCLSRTKVICDFPTRDALLDAVTASAVIPGLTAPARFQHASGRAWMDGVHVHAPPPTVQRPQLVLDLMRTRAKLNYPLPNLIRTVDADFDVNLCAHGLKHITTLLGKGQAVEGIHFNYAP